MISGAPLAKKFDTFLLQWWPQFAASERLLFIFENRPFKTYPTLAAQLPEILRSSYQRLW